MREALLVPVGVVMVVTGEAVQQALSKRLRQFRSEKQLKFDEAPFWKWAAVKRSAKLKTARSVSIPKINQGLADAPLTDMINAYMRETGCPGAAAPNVSSDKGAKARLTRRAASAVRHSPQDYAFPARSTPLLSSGGKPLALVDPDDFSPGMETPSVTICSGNKMGTILTKVFDLN